MSAQIDDGGPVYPGQWIDSLPTTGEQVVREQWFGMSLRDWFAGQALIGIAQAVTVTQLQGAGQTPPDDIAAKWALGFADAMIAARKGGQP